MASETLKKIAVNLILNNGTSTSGAVKTLSISMGTISNTGYDATKCNTLGGLISQCLAKPIYDLRKVETKSIA